MYKLVKNPDTGAVDTVVKIEVGMTVSFQMNPDNTDYQAYLKWLAEGNTPLPADKEVA